MSGTGTLLSLHAFVASTGKPLPFVCPQRSLNKLISPQYQKQVKHCPKIISYRTRWLRSGRLTMAKKTVKTCVRVQTLMVIVRTELLPSTFSYANWHEVINLRPQQSTIIICNMTHEKKKGCGKTLRLKQIKASQPASSLLSLLTVRNVQLLLSVSIPLSCCQEQVRTPSEFILAVTHSVDDRCEFLEGPDCPKGYRIVLSPVRQMHDSTSIKP